jgi:hypothetical protein
MDRTHTSHFSESESVTHEGTCCTSSATPFEPGSMLNCNSTDSLSSDESQKQGPKIMQAT